MALMLLLLKELARIVWAYTFTFRSFIKQPLFVRPSDLVTLGVAQCAAIFPVISASNFPNHRPFQHWIFSLVSQSPVIFRQFGGVGFSFVNERSLVSSVAFFKRISGSPDINFVVSIFRRNIGFVDQVCYLAFAV